MEIQNNRPHPEPGPVPRRAPKPLHTSIRKPLRAVSKKRAALIREVQPIRREWLAEVGACMICRQSPAIECHEIACGYARESCLNLFELVLGVCRRCHRRAERWKPAKQIAALVMWEIDKRCEAYCEMRGVAGTHVERNSVLGYLDYAKEFKQ